MTDNTSQTLPKWPFLAGDIILVLLACFIVIASPKPMTALTIFACALSVILGMLVFVTPYLIEHLTAQQTIKLKQVKAEETLLKAVDLASDLLNRTETIHAELMKSVLVSKQVPAKLEEKAEELADLLSSKENEEIISLKNEIETLKVLDSDKLAASVSKFGKLIDSLDSITPEQNTKSGIDRNELLKLFESQRADSRSNAENLKEILNNTLSQFRDELLERNKETDAAPSVEQKSKAEKTKAANHFEDESSEIIVGDNITSESEPIGSQINEDESYIEEEFEKDEDPNPKSEVEPESKDDAVKELETKPSEDGATRLLVGAFIGISNRLFIRGEGPGLNWDKGVPMELVGIGKWEWKTFDAQNPIRCKVLINDEQWTDSENIDLEPNTTVETTASF